MTDTLLSSQKEAESRIFVTDEDGDIMLGQDDADARKIVETSRSGRIRSGINRMAGDRYRSIVNYHKMGFQELTVYYAEYPDMLGSSIRHFRNLIILSCTVVLSVLLVLVFLGIRAAQKPYSRLAEEVRQKLGKEVPHDGAVHLGKNEFMVLNTGMKYLLENIETLNNSVREHGNIIRREYLIQWVMSGRLSEPAERYLRKNSCILSCHRMILAVLRIESYSLFAKTNNYTRRKIIKTQIEDIAVKSLTSASYISESMDIGGDHILLLVSGEALDIDRTREALDHVRQEIAQALATRLAVAVSEVLQVGGNLREAYDRAYETSLLGFMGGMQTVYTAQDYDNYLSALEPFSEDDSIREIIQNVRTGNKAAAVSKLDSLFEGLRHLTYDECKFKITTVIYRIVKSFKLTVTLNSFESIEEVVEGCSSLAEIQEWIVRTIDQLIEQHHDSFERRFARQDLILEIIEYFRNHMTDPQMSPDSISARISLSTNYVRRIFKESTGSSLSRYMLEQRVETAKRHLTTTDETMTEIAAQAGFLTRSGFFAAFKKETGVTPGAYRDKFRVSEGAPTSAG